MGSNFEWGGGNIYCFGINSSSGAVVTTIDFFFGSPSSSSPMKTGAVRDRVLWNAMFKYLHRIDLGSPCDDTWSSPVRWIPLTRIMNLNRTIGLNLIVQSHMKEKHI